VLCRTVHKMVVVWVVVQTKIICIAALETNDSGWNLVCLGCICANGDDGLCVLCANLNY